MSTQGQPATFKPQSWAPQESANSTARAELAAQNSILTPGLMGRRGYVQRRRDTRSTSGDTLEPSMRTMTCVTG